MRYPREFDRRRAHSRGKGALRASHRAGETRLGVVWVTLGEAWSGDAVAAPGTCWSCTCCCWRRRLLPRRRSWWARRWCCRCSRPSSGRSRRGRSRSSCPPLHLPDRHWLPAGAGGRPARRRGTDSWWGCSCRSGTGCSALQTAVLLPYGIRQIPADAGQTRRAGTWTSCRGSQAGSATVQLARGWQPQLGRARSAGWGSSRRRHRRRHRA